MKNTRFTVYSNLRYVIKSNEIINYNSTVFFFNYRISIMYRISDEVVFASNFLMLILFQNTLSYVYVTYFGILIRADPVTCYEIPLRPTYNISTGIYIYMSQSTF